MRQTKLKWYYYWSGYSPSYWSLLLPLHSVFCLSANISNHILYLKCNWFVQKWHAGSVLLKSNGEKEWVIQGHWDNTKTWQQTAAPGLWKEWVSFEKLILHRFKTGFYPVFSCSAEWTLSNIVQIFKDCFTLSKTSHWSATCSNTLKAAQH